MNETVDITSPVLVALSKLPGGIFYRVNCGLFLTLDGRRHLRSVSIDGVADIMGTYRGYSVAVETKRRTKKQQQSQRFFQKRHVAAGGIYIISYDPGHAVFEIDRLCTVRTPL